MSFPILAPSLYAIMPMLQVNMLIYLLLYGEIIVIKDPSGKGLTNIVQILDGKETPFCMLIDLVAESKGIKLCCSYIRKSITMMEFGKDIGSCSIAFKMLEKCLVKDLLFLWL